MDDKRQKRTRTRRPKSQVFLSSQTDFSETSLKSALDKVAAYIAAGKSKDAKHAVEQLLGWSTVRGWLKNRDAANYAYQAPLLVKAVAGLPPVGDPRFDAYSYILRELGEGRSHLESLTAYSGSYHFAHSFPSDYVQQIRSLYIKVDPSDGFAQFAFKYNIDDRRGRFISDGFVFAQASKLCLVGLSPSSIFFGMVNSSADPKQERLMGIAMFKDLFKDGVIASPIILTSRDREAIKSEQMEQLLQDKCDLFLRSGVLKI